MEEILQQVRDFADKAHGDQMRKYSSERYIVHPVRVMNTCRQYNTSLPVLSAALLHDVFEDTPVSKHMLHQFLLSIMKEELANQVVQLVVELTDVYTKEKHPRLNRKRRKQKEARRLSKVSGEAQTIKYADIIDNCNEIVNHDPDFAPRFLSECHLLLLNMAKGEARLHSIAKDIVEKQLRLIN